MLDILVLRKRSASMGPRRRSRGKPSQHCVSTMGLTTRFNGATTKESWKTSERRPPLPRIRLQWGHDEGVVENDQRVIGKAKLVALQWGHDEGVVENDHSAAQHEIRR